MYVYVMCVYRACIIDMYIKNIWHSIIYNMCTLYMYTHEIYGMYIVFIEYT